MKKSGFTLIELLAVIVILAIIALIATPIILGVINDAKEQADLRAVEGYAQAVENASAQYMLQHSGDQPTTFSDYATLVETRGASVSCSVVDLSGGALSMDYCKVGSGTTFYKYNSATGATVSGS